MKQKMTAAMLVLALAFASGCGTFARKENVVFVREDVTADGSPRSILKTTEETETRAAYFDGEDWIVTDVTIPAGWLVVSPAVMEDPEG